MHNTHVIYGPLVHASGVHEVAEHGARRAENVENCSKWPKMRTLMVGANEAHARLGPECAIGLVPLAQLALHSPHWKIGTPYMLQPLLTSHALKTGHALTELFN